jgi:hypothetical protein
MENGEENNNGLSGWQESEGKKEWELTGDGGVEEFSCMILGYPTSSSHPCRCHCAFARDREGISRRLNFSKTRILSVNGHFCNMAT